jgi:hypothetical protein
MHRAMKRGYSEFGAEQPREYWATIAIVAASAVSAGSSAYSASQAGGGAGGGRAPRYSQPPEPRYERALRHYTARLLAQGATSVPPSFLDYVASGGTAKFDLGDTRMTPGEAISLGEFAPFKVAPGQRQLTLDQLLYLSNLPPGSLGAGAALRREGSQYRRLQKLEGERQTPGRERREERLTKKLKKTDFGPFV